MEGKNEELSFGDILQQQSKAGVKRAKVKVAKMRHNSDDEAPFEMSSKKPNMNFNTQSYKKKSDYSMDPRFSSKCGNYNEEKFRKNFEYAFELRDQELAEMKEQKKMKQKVKVEDDSEVKQKIQRMENQKREFEMKKIKKSQTAPREANYYPSKRKQRAEDLLTKFKELKQSGKLEKYLDKRRKKQSSKSRKKMNIEK